MTTLLKYLIVIGLVLGAIVMAVDFRFSRSIVSQLERAAEAEMHHDHDARDAIILAIRKGQGRSSVDYLISTVHDARQDTLVRLMAQKALRQFESDYERSLIFNAPMRRLVAAIGLEVEPDESTFDYAQAVTYASSVDPGYRVGAVRRLGELGTRDGFRHVAALVDDPYWLVRKEVVRALCVIDPSEGWRIVIDLFDDPVSIVRHQAIVYAARTGPKERLFPLLSDLRDDNFVAVAEGFGELGDLRAVSLLEEGLASPLPEYRFAAARGLLRLDEPSGLEHLLEVIVSGEEENRAKAARLLTLDDSTRSLSVLVETLSDQSPIVRAAAVESLGHRGPLPVVLASIRSALADSDDRVVAAALRAIAQTDDARLIQMAQEYLGRGSVDLQIAAIDTLVSVDETGIVPALERIIDREEGTSPRLMAHAVRALRTLTGRPYDLVDY